MKKTLLFLLSLLFVLSAFVLPAFASTDGEETAADYRSISIEGFNVPINGMKLDDEPFAGTGCMRMEFSESGPADQIVFANYNTPYDLSKYDTVEFELYLSDPSFFEIIKYGDASFELTSAGTYDKEEISWKLYDLPGHIEGGPKKGWNHVVLPFDSARTNMKPAFDRINFFRFYIVGANGVKSPMTIKIDNLRAVDSTKPSLDALREQCVPVAEMINAIGATEVTKENYESVKAQVEAAKAAFLALSEDAQGILDDETFRKLNRLNSLIQQYEQNPPETEGKTADTETKAKTEESAAPEEKKGCGSSVCALALLPLLAAVCVKKKK